MEIRKAGQSDLPELSRLFDLYRQFYQCAPDIKLAAQFMTDRMSNNESTVFVASENGRLSGFVQLYPSFCSVDAIKIFILYDLYVDQSVRNTGRGKALMDRATKFARDEDVTRIDLCTAFDNKAGQHLYEKLGYKKVNEDYYTYSLSVPIEP